MNRIKNILTESEPFQSLFRALRGITTSQPIAVTGISGSLLAFTAAGIFESRGKQTVLLVPDKDRAEQLRDDCSILLGERSVHLYASAQAHRSVQLDISAPIAQVEALRALSRKETILLIASVEALTGKIPPQKDFSSRTIDISVQNEYPFEELLKRLDKLGFEKKDFVEEYGDYALRGGIIDIFPFIGEHPLRFEFWGNTVESIREFDAVSQRSIRELQSASIVADIHAGQLRDETAETAEEHDTLQNPQASLFDYLQTDALFIIEEPDFCRKEAEELSEEGINDLFGWDDIEKNMHHFSCIIHSQISVPVHDTVIKFNSSPQPPTAGSVKRLIEYIRTFGEKKYSVYLDCDSKDETARLSELIEEELTSPGDQSGVSIDESSGTERIDAHMPAYQFVTGGFHSGFVFHSAQIAVFTEHEIFGRLKRRGSSRRKKFKGISQKELQQLRRGDFVVHQDYGIGKFAGLQKITVRGVETEVMKLLYDSTDSLYVNLNFINRVQKYSSQEGHTPKLSRIGGPEWERLKNRARKKIKDIARDLIRLYARRKHEEGFAFAPDVHWQKEMEASFMYEDTPDQAKATTDVKRDMEDSSPMDRLICGDVGFGKTEVAVRAAFKAVMNGKQAAVLVPTTILAQQHYQTFSDRVGRYSVRVECLNRFRTKKEQAEILEALKNGRIDIIIGTHRLLSKDVVFKNIGLLVIDEEHRFGVGAKEKLRQMRATVDTLTLTATPIPRTLQFSLMGARDLSLITTPPRNRLPIHTEIAEFNVQLMREAIMKELHRGGQVYFVHDRIQNIDIIQNVLQDNIPKARFHIAHGQMKGHELEKAMLDFLEKKFDVLLCTKIIESGIDIPSVNTIIINRADRFGMAELYQLRGRVGRSNVQAYAYLLTPPLSVLPRPTLRRLQAIQEFTELGSGFNLAMRDLEIRGAGNLLGGEQSGFILEMGFEMYQRVVEDAVRELKEEEFSDLIDTAQREQSLKKTESVVEADCEALIPELYVESDAERLDIYRRLYRFESLSDCTAMRQELKDRFGEYPEEVEHLLRLIELKILASSMRLTKVELVQSTLKLFFPSPEEKSFYEGDLAPFQRYARRMQEADAVLSRLKQEGKQMFLELRLPKMENEIDRLTRVRQYLDFLNLPE